jgi:hypothetical protein
MMASCDFQLRGNWWICLTCGIVVPKRGDKPPKGMCAGRWLVRKTNAGGKRRRPKQTLSHAIMANYDALVATKGPDNQLPREEVERRVAICIGNQCGQFTGTGCKERTGSPCKAGQRWFERVTAGNCRHWLAAP